MTTAMTTTATTMAAMPMDADAVADARGKAGPGVAVQEARGGMGAGAHEGGCTCGDCPHGARAGHRRAVAEFLLKRDEFAAGQGLPAAVAHSAVRLPAVGLRRTDPVRGPRRRTRPRRGRGLARAACGGARRSPCGAPSWPCCSSSPSPRSARAGRPPAPPGCSPPCVVAAALTGASLVPPGARRGAGARHRRGQPPVHLPCGRGRLGAASSSTPCSSWWAGWPPPPATANATP